MNVLMVSQYFWPEGFRVNDLVLSLKAHGVHVDVLTGKPNYPKGALFDGYRMWGCQVERWEGIDLHRVPLAPRGDSGALRLLLNYLSFIVFGTLFGAWMLRGKKADVVFVYGMSPILQAIPAVFLKWVKGAKLVVWVQDLWPESLEATGFVRNRLALALVRMVVRWIYRRADLILVQSEAFIAPVAALADPAKVKYYPNSADDVFKALPTDAPCDIAGLEAGFSVVFAGNLGNAQAVDTIIEAAALLRDYPVIRLYLVGSGSRSAWLAQQVISRGLSNVILAGQFPLTSMPGILGRASALLVTLKDASIFNQTIPSKIQAYLAMGKPIIACLNGEGARIVSKAGAGISCPAEDPAALARTIIALQQMTAPERAAMGEQARLYFDRHFDSAMLTDVLIDHLAALPGVAGAVNS